MFSFFSEIHLRRGDFTLGHNLLKGSLERLDVYFMKLIFCFLSTFSLPPSLSVTSSPVGRNTGFLALIFVTVHEKNRRGVNARSSTKQFISYLVRRPWYFASANRYSGHAGWSDPSRLFVSDKSTKSIERAGRRESRTGIISSFPWIRHRCECFLASILNFNHLMLSLLMSNGPFLFCFSLTWSWKLGSEPTWRNKKKTLADEWSKILQVSHGEAWRVRTGY